MSFVHAICGDGESDDGVGVFGMAWIMTDGTVCSAAGEYLERPESDVNTLELPTYRSDTVQFITGTDINAYPPNATAVNGTVVTFATNILPFRAAGTALVDSDGVLYYVASYDGYDVTVDREGFATGRIEGFYPPTPRVLTYGAHAEGVPHVDKYYSQVWAAFQVIRGGRSFSLATRAYNSRQSSTTSQTTTYDADLTEYLFDSREYLTRREMPTDQTRTIGVTFSITLGDPVCYWQLGAVAFTMDPKGNRTGSPRD